LEIKIKKQYVELLMCPNTGEDLILEVIECRGDEVIEGLLHSSGHTYVIRNGIPRFVKDEGYSDNFGWQWNKWARVQFEDENVGRPMSGHTTDMFKKITELDEQKISGKSILDIGCGPGRFVDTAISLGAGLVVAVDYSTAIDAAKSNFEAASDILFIQGDALNLPLKNEVFDFVYSIGVLHHTPSPQKGIGEAYRVVKDGGEAAVAVYKKGGYYDYPAVQFWRRTFKILWPLFGHYPPYMYSQVFGGMNHFLRKVCRPLSLATRLFFPSVTLPDVRWSVLDTFDSITPSYQSAHTVFEMFEWFRKERFRNIRVAAWENIIGQKKA
jgi:ubiquinone/menaquinone biosynthesis C-methylase UbiE/uncharacterized protein YbaR (Trm112 family)